MAAQERHVVTLCALLVDMVSERDQRRTGSGSAPRRTATRPKPAVGPVDAARNAYRVLSDLITHRPEAVSGVSRSEEGWRVHVDVLELPRIPDTTSLLATYEVELDEHGELRQYRRVRRFRRGAADE